MAPIKSCILRDGDSKVTVLSVGCAIQDWTVGEKRVVLGYSNPQDYLTNPASMGVVVGRVANRIAGSQFSLNGQVWKLPINHGASNHIHGGPNGLGRRNWDLEECGPNAAFLRVRATPEDDFYPGTVDFEIKLTLRDGSLEWKMTGVPDCATPINLAQHLYFNLSGAPTIENHRFQILSDRYTQTDSQSIPTGKLIDVDNSRFDLRTPTVFSQHPGSDLGYDLNYAINASDHHVAEVLSENGMRFRIFTDQPGLQFYSSSMLEAHGTPWPDVAHGPMSAFCMEAQKFPNAVNIPEFASIISSPDAIYEQTTRIEIIQT